MKLEDIFWVEVNIDALKGGRGYKGKISNLFCRRVQQREIM